MQRTLISTTIHFWPKECWLKLQTNKMETPKKERLKKKGWANYALSDNSASFSFPRSHSFFITFFHFSAIQKSHKTKICIFLMSINLLIDHLHWNLANSCFLPSIQQQLLPRSGSFELTELLCSCTGKRIVSNWHYLRTLIGRLLPPISTCSRHIK